MRNAILVPKLAHLAMPHPEPEPYLGFASLPFSAVHGFLKIHTEQGAGPLAQAPMADVRVISSHCKFFAAMRSRRCMAVAHAPALVETSESRCRLRNVAGVGFLALKNQV